MSTGGGVVETTSEPKPCYSYNYAERVRRRNDDDFREEAPRQELGGGQRVEQGERAFGAET